METALPKEPKHIRQANFEQNREQECNRCHEKPCKCDRGEQL